MFELISSEGHNVRVMVPWTKSSGHGGYSWEEIVFRGPTRWVKFSSWKVCEDGEEMGWDCGDTVVVDKNPNNSDCGSVERGEKHAGNGNTVQRQDGHHCLWTLDTNTWQSTRRCDRCHEHELSILQEYRGKNRMGLTETWCWYAEVCRVEQGHSKKWH